jgi:hypothetical protein
LQQSGQVNRTFVLGGTVGHAPVAQMGGVLFAIDDLGEMDRGDFIAKVAFDVHGPCPFVPLWGEEFP